MMRVIPLATRVKYSIPPRAGHIRMAEFAHGWVKGVRGQ